MQLLQSLPCPTNANLSPGRLLQTVKEENKNRAFENIYGTKDGRAKGEEKLKAVISSSHTDHSPFPQFLYNLEEMRKLQNNFSFDK